MEEMKKYTKWIQDMNAVLSERKINHTYENDQKIEEISCIMLNDIENMGEAIKNHYNNIVYNVNNGGSGVKKYDERSILRELFQNIIDCDYDNNLKIEISFDDKNHEVSFFYNEYGFKISNVIAFFSLGHTSKTGMQTGAFGIGAKGALLNASNFKIHSICSECGKKIQTDFSIKTINLSGIPTLEIEDVHFSKLYENSLTNGTLLNIRFRENLYKKIRSNLDNIAGRDKGEYLTPIDLTFASLKKPNRDIEINISNNIFLYLKYDENSKQTKFLYNKSGVEFNVYYSENSQYTYIFYRSRVECEDMPSYIKEHSYNYFSTYELVGDKEDMSQNGIKFFVNIPTLDVDGSPYITYDRTGIEPNKVSKVKRNLYKDCLQMIQNYTNKSYFFSADGYSYMLEQFYDIYLKQFCNDIQFKKALCSNTFWKIDNNNMVRLSDIMFLKYEDSIMEEIKKIPNRYFCLVQINKPHKKTPYSKFMEYSYVFSLYIGDEKKSTIRQEEEWEYQYTNAPKKEIAVDILQEYANHNTKDISSIYLLSINISTTFSEEMLKKLMFVCNKYKSRINFSFDSEKKSIWVDDKEYIFEDGFVVEKRETLVECMKFCKDTEELVQFKDYILKKYKDSILEGINNSIDKIKRYRKHNFKFSFNDENKLEIKLDIGVNYFTIETIDLDGLEYSEVVETTKMTNFRLLKGKLLDEEFVLRENVETAYEYDVEKIRYFSQREDLTFLNIFLCDCSYDLGDKDLLILVNQQNIIIEITDNFSSDIIKTIPTSDVQLFLLLPKRNENGRRRNLSISIVSKFLDFLFDTNCIYNLYHKIDKPVIKLFDQIDYRLKPITTIKEVEVSEIGNYLKHHSKNKEKLTEIFARDINNKLYGYSTICPLCQYQSESINAFLVKQGVDYYENGKRYSISFFLCANEWYESDGWLIEEILFMDERGEYSVCFAKWIKKIKEFGDIKFYNLKCKITISKKISNRLFDLDNQVAQDEKLIKNMILTPAMAVKWYEENKNIDDSI